MKKTVLIHLPHCSTYIPPDEIDKILIDDHSLSYEILRLTDWYTDEIFRAEGLVVHKNEFSRILFDPERFRDEGQETMSKFGMGVIYTKTLDGLKLRHLTDTKREEMVKKYYDPYHLILEKKVEILLETFGKCLIIDGHSFPNNPLPFEKDKISQRPDICIGTDKYHTPELLVQLIEEHTKNNDMTVMRDFPFAGTMVPMKYYQKEKRVKSVMIEINRRLYMDETTGEKNNQFTRISSFISDLVQKLTKI